eukprot:1143608-Pelagomonas_calceolata.AAC.3
MLGCACSKVIAPERAVIVHVRAQCVCVSESKFKRFWAAASVSILRSFSSGCNCCLGLRLASASCSCCLSLRCALLGCCLFQLSEVELLRGLPRPFSNQAIAGARFCCLVMTLFGLSQGFMARMTSAMQPGCTSFVVELSVLHARSKASVPELAEQCVNLTGFYARFALNLLCICSLIKGCGCLQCHASFWFVLWVAPVILTAYLPDNSQCYLFQDHPTDMAFSATLLQRERERERERERALGQQKLSILHSCPQNNACSGSVM